MILPLLLGLLVVQAPPLDSLNLAQATQRPAVNDSLGHTGALAFSAPARAQTPLTLAGALAEARAHNATLPIAGFDTLMTAAQIRIAHARAGPTVGIDGDIHDGAPSRYASGDARLQLAGSLPILDGGRLRAGVHRAEADRAMSAAQFRIARRDLDYDVTVWFSQGIDLQEEVALEQQGLDRLRRYLELISARRQSGQAVAGDLLKAQVQRGRQAADLAETRRALANASLQLKELLGREPEDTLVFAPLPPPVAPGPAVADAWTGAPDVAVTDAAEWSARTTIAALQADRRPHVDLGANIGAQPLIGSSRDAPLNTGRGLGGELTISLNWPLWDRGVYRNELAQAQLGLQQSSQLAVVARRHARLQWYQARADLTHLYEVVQLRDSTVPTAADAYLQSESLYRGGAADALEVLDSYAQWIQAGLDATRARFSYRIAQASETRWGPE